MFVCVCLWSLQELLLCPVWRIQEYVTLLQALSVHTHPGHPDHTHLSSALNILLRFREFIQKVQHPHRALSQGVMLILHVESAAYPCSVQWTHRCFLLFQLKRNSERDRLMEETQQMIQGCPVKTQLLLTLSEQHKKTYMLRYFNMNMVCVVYVCVESQWRKQAADNNSGCCFAQEPWWTDSWLAQVTTRIIHVPVGVTCSDVLSVYIQKCSFT